jgi:hypothetical protein
MRNLTALELGADLRQERFQPVRALGHERLQATDRHLSPQPVREQLRGALIRQVLVGHQVNPQRPDPRTVGHRRPRLRGKLRTAQLAAAPAQPLLDPMRMHTRLGSSGRSSTWRDRRLHDRRIAQISATAITLRERMHDLVIRDLPALQMMTRRARLSTRLTSEPPPQTPLLLRLISRRLRQSIRRWRPRGVARVLRKPRTQLGDQRFQFPHPPRPLGDQRVPLGEHHRLLRDPRLRTRYSITDGFIV